MKNFNEFNKSSINEQTYDESRVKHLDSISRSKIVIFLQETGIELGEDFIYNAVTKKYITSNKEVAESIIDEMASFNQLDNDIEVSCGGPDELSVSDVELIKKFKLNWQVPFTVELNSLNKEVVTEAQIKGNLGIPGEDGEGDSYLDKIKRQKDAEFGNVNPGRLVGELGGIQSFLSRNTSGNEEELEKLAEELMVQLYGSVLPEGLDFDIKFVSSGGDVKSFLDEMAEKANKRKEPEEEEEEEENNDEQQEAPKQQTSEERKKQIKIEVDRRKMSNLIVQGEALNVKTVIEMPECKNEIKRILGEEIGEEYIQKLIRLTQICKALDWFTPVEHKASMMENHPEGFAGASHVDWDNEDEDEEGGEEGSDEEGQEEDMSPVLRVVGLDFVMLIHESVKAVYQYLSTPGIADDPEIAQIVKQQTSSFADEAEEFKYGPEIAAELRDFINVNSDVDKYPNTREFVYISLMEMDAEDFLKLMKGILSATPSARKKVDELIKEFVDSMKQYEKELAEWEMSQKFSEEPESSEEDEESEVDKMIRLASTGSEEKEPEAIDPSELSKSEIRNLIDDALDRRDFEEVEKLSKYLNESVYISVLESYIDSKNK
jgi:hypothetical protein